MKHLLALAAATLLVCSPSISAQDEADSIKKIEAEFQAAGTADDKIDGKEMKEFAERALAIAKNKGGRTAYQGTLWALYIIRVGETKAEDKKALRESATDLIVARYANSSSIGELLNELRPGGRAEKADCDACVARIAKAATKPAAKKAIRSFRMQDLIFNMRALTTPKQKKEALATFKAQVAEAGDERCPFDREKRSWKQVLKGPIFELENLQVGMVAPDIEGPDFDGVTFKLSDYRGKVVFLDFWAHW